MFDFEVWVYYFNFEKYDWIQKIQIDFKFEEYL
jgi:hypothetical protein